MADTVWESARLIPVSGINGAEEQERRGASALLAVLQSVREFGRAILGPFGAPVGHLSAFIEVNFTHDGRKYRPDGLVRVTRGQQTWTALVEVKTGRNSLEVEQLHAYLDIARDEGFNAVITISNELVTAPDEHPTTVDKRRLKKVDLHHLSWSQIHTEAVVERENRLVADPDQAWILAELIRYLEHPRSGAVDFDDMGPSWVTVRNSVTNRTLRANDSGAGEVIGRFGQLVSFASMRLSRQLGVDVRPALTKAERSDVGGYVQAGVARLVESGILRGAIQVPNAVAPIEVTADLRSGLVTCSISVAAPGAGKSTTRVNWLVRQLGAAPDAVLMEAWPLWARAPGPCHPISVVREDPSVLIEDPKRELKSFTVRLSANAGTKSGHGRGTFVGSVLTLVDEFYERVVQHVKPWTPPAPTARLKQDDRSADEDGISGELPTRTIQRAMTPPTFEPPEPVEAGDVQYTTAVAREEGIDEAAALRTAGPPPAD